ncbi:MAG TPA: FRG domain-containing protein [Solirubrobacteraceae bacterium]
MTASYSVSDVDEFSLPEGEATFLVRRVSHERFGSLLAPETPSGLFALINLIASQFDLCGWRGQSSLEWPIDSGIVRRVRSGWSSMPPSVTGGSLANAVMLAEEALLSRARLAGHDLLLARRLADLEILALLQHHGAATRLLDCTANAFAAAWFGCGGSPDGFGLLAAFDLGLGHHVRSADERAAGIAELADATKERFLVWRPSTLTPRIAAQQGFFVFSDIVEEPWGSVRFTGTHLAQTGKVPGLSLVALSPKLKLELNRIWPSVFGYSDETLFPDLDGFARVHGAQRVFPAGFFNA